MRKLHSALWGVPALMVIVALAPLPYGYYVLLRLIVAVSAGLIAYHQFQMDEKLSLWVIAMGFLAVLYNPVVPIHFSKDIWIGINLATATIYAAHFFAVRRV